MHPAHAPETPCSASSTGAPTPQPLHGQSPLGGIPTHMRAVCPGRFLYICGSSPAVCGERLGPPNRRSPDDDSTSTTQLPVSVPILRPPVRLNPLALVTVPVSPPERRACFHPQRRVLLSFDSSDTGRGRPPSIRYALHRAWKTLMSIQVKLHRTSSSGKHSDCISHSGAGPSTASPIRLPKNVMTHINVLDVGSSHCVFRQ